MKARFSFSIPGCFVVLPTRQSTSPLYVAADLDRSLAFARAAAFVKQLNRVSSSGKAVIRRASAVVAVGSQMRST